LTAERAVLGNILLDPETLDAVFLKSEDFANETNRQIFDTMCELADKSVSPDLVSVTSALSGKVSAATLHELVDEGGFPSMTGHYCREVRKRSTARKLIIACREIQKEVEDDNALDLAEAKIMEIREGSGAKQTAVSVRAVLGPVFKELEQLGKNKSHITGIPTGYTELDAMTAGLQPKDLIIIAGRPSMGKTAFVINITENAAESGKKSLIFSLEMSKEQLVKRQLSSVGRIDGQRLRTGQFQEGDWSRMTDASGKIANMPIWIDDSYGMGVMDLRAKARRHKRQHGLDLIVIDYLQLMQMPKAESRNLSVGEITRRLKALAKELNVPVVCLSQLSRDLEKRTDKRPLMSDLRDSGSIEQDADVVIFPYREAEYCEKCKQGNCDIAHHKRRSEVIIGKQRNGPTGTIKLVWLPEFSRFGNLDEFRGTL